MTATVERRRAIPRTETTSIPTNRFSGQSLLDRTVSGQVFLDRNLMAGTGCVSVPQREMSQSLSKLMVATDISTIGAAGCFSAALKTAQEELFAVNKAAVRVFISFTQSDHLSASSRFSSIVEDIVKSLFQTAQVPVQDVESEQAPAFYDPIKFDWSNQAHRIRQAAKRYSERTNADY